MHSILKVSHSLQTNADFKVFFHSVTVYLVIAFTEVNLNLAHMCMSMSVFSDNYIINIKIIPYSLLWYMHNFNVVAMVFMSNCLL